MWMPALPFSSLPTSHSLLSSVGDETPGISLKGEDGEGGKLVIYLIAVKRFVGQSDLNLANYSIMPIVTSFMLECTSLVSPFYLFS